MRTGTAAPPIARECAVRGARSARSPAVLPGNRIGRRWSMRATGWTSCTPATPPAISRLARSPQRPPPRRPPPPPGRSRPVRCASLDGKLAEDRPRDVSQHHHHVPERPRRPYQFLAFGRCRDRQFRDVLLVDGERRFLGARGLPVLDRRPRAHLAGPDHQHPNPILAQCFSKAEIEAVQAGLGGSVYEVGPSHPLASGRAHRDDLAEALRAHLLADEHTDRNGCCVVDLGDLHGWGSYGIMALVQNPFSDTLGEASRLTGIPEEKLKTDRAANIRGGAALLASAVGAQKSSRLAGYFGAVAGRGGASGKDYQAVAGIGGGELYAEQVFDALERGIPEEKLKSGERLSLEAQSLSDRIGAP